MKRLLFVVAGLLVCLNLAYANDLLFKASNGALNQNSVGVKKLTETELMQVKAGWQWFGFERNSKLDFIQKQNGRIIYGSYAYVVVDNYASASERYSSAAKRLGFDPAYYGSGVMVVGKVRVINRQKQHFMQVGTNKNNLSNVWNYGAMTPVYDAFRQRY